MTHTLSLGFEGTVQSVVRSRTNGPLLAAAAELWISPGDLVLDVTYGKGNFWTVVRPPGLVTHDLALDGVDFRHLPELDGSVDVLVLDPPYIAQGGRNTSTTPDFLDRYGLRNCPTSVNDLHAMNDAGIVEAHRVLKPGGKLMVKCMNYINGRRFTMGHHRVVSTALAAGFDQVDEFIHASGTGPQPLDRGQQHARNAHSFLCVFEKVKRTRKAMYE